MAVKSLTIESLTAVSQKFFRHKNAPSQIQRHSISGTKTECFFRKKKYDYQN